MSDGAQLSTAGRGRRGEAAGPDRATGSAAGAGAADEIRGGNAAGSDPVKAWLGAVRARIEAAKRYPMFARRLRLEGTVVLSFEIDGDGQLLGVRAREDAPVLLREAAIEAVRRAAPFPRPPEGKRTVNVEVPLVFSLTRD